MSWDQLPGWFDYQDIYNEAIAGANNFETLVEVGVAFGRSLSYLAREAINHTKKLRIFGVDPLVDDWDSDRPTWGAEHRHDARAQGGPYNALVAGMREQAREELEYCRLVRVPSVMAARMFDDASLFFVFIDGSHHYEDVRDDLEAWERKIRPGGIFAGHDHTAAFPGVRQAVAERWGDGRTAQRGASWYRRVP